MVLAKRGDVTSSLRRNVASATLGKLYWSSNINSTFLWSSIVLYGHLFLDLTKNRQHFDRCLFEQRVPLVVYYADVVVVSFIVSVFCQLVHVEITLILGLIYQIMPNFYC